MTTDDTPLPSVPPPISAPFPAPDEARGALVLDIEEQTDLSRIRGRILTRIGFPVEEVHDIERAADRVFSEPRPALVVLCRKQVTVGRAIRALEAADVLPRLPILVAGGGELESLIEQGRAAGGDAVCRHGPVWSFVEAVLRTGWPDAFARAWEASGRGVLPDAWPVNAAPVSPGEA
jgi:hypothetical protein